MTYSNRFFLYAPLGVVLILFAAAGWHWWSLASALSAQLEAANGHDIIPGVHFHFTAKKMSGFPFRLDAELSGVTLAMAAGMTAWRSEKLALHRLTYGRDETIFEAAGRQSLQWGDKRLDFAVGALRASAIRKQGALARFDVDLVGLGSAAFTARRLQLHARRSGPLADIAVEADGVAAKNCRTPSTLRSIAKIVHADGLTPLLAGERSWQQGLAAWRRQGGAVTADPPFAEIIAEQLPGIGAIASAVCR
jgi:hypothetical protein